MLTKEELDNRFTYHAPTELKINKYSVLRQQTKNLAGIINELCPEGRETSLALTKLEEAVMWANAAIARSS